MEDNIFGKLELDRRCFQYRALEDEETYDNYFISKCFVAQGIFEITNYFKQEF